MSHGVDVETVEVVGDHEAAGARDDHGERRVVTVDNKDSADTIRLRVPVSLTVQDVIDKTYEEFRLTRQPDDRLTCRGNGEDVYQFAAHTLAQYLDEGHCHDLHWSFAGDTGGAGR